MATVPSERGSRAASPLAADVAGGLAAPAEACAADGASCELADRSCLAIELMVRYLPNAKGSNCGVQRSTAPKRRKCYKPVGQGCVAARKIGAARSAGKVGAELRSPGSDAPDGAAPEGASSE